MSVKKAVEKSTYMFYPKKIEKAGKSRNVVFQTDNYMETQVNLSTSLSLPGSQNLGGKPILRSAMTPHMRISGGPQAESKTVQPSYSPPKRTTQKVLDDSPNPQMKRQRTLNLV